LKFTKLHLRGGNEAEGAFTLIELVAGPNVRVPMFSGIQDNPGEYVGDRRPRAERMLIPVANVEYAVPAEGEAVLTGAEQLLADACADWPEPLVEEALTVDSEEFIQYISAMLRAGYKILGGPCPWLRLGRAHPGNGEPCRHCGVIDD
jgi:hypothetical protein